MAKIIIIYTDDNISVQKEFGIEIPTDISFDEYCSNFYFSNDILGLSAKLNIDIESIDNFLITN